MYTHTDLFAYLGHSGGALLVLFGPYLLSLPQPRPHIDVKSDISASNHLKDHSCNSLKATTPDQISIMSVDLGEVEVLVLVLVGLFNDAL